MSERKRAKEPEGEAREMSAESQPRPNLTDSCEGLSSHMGTASPEPAHRCPAACRGTKR